MTTRQGDVALLDGPVAQELLHSATPVRVAYVSRDGTPRVVPTWFHWDGTDIVLGTPVESPKVRAISANPNVALTIDNGTWPYKALQIRGIARVETVQGVVPEYALAAQRYLGAQGGEAWIEQIRGMFSQMARIAVRPAWVAVLDFEQRFPNAIEAAMMRH
jgi:pyridoxine/pyridoxamine 5'-phosphate oxidase